MLAALVEVLATDAPVGSATRWRRPPRAGVALGPSATAAALLAVSSLHVAWGLGSTAPFSNAEDLSEAVLGRVPSGGAFVDPPACFAVAGALATAASLVADRPRWPGAVRQLGLGVLTGTLVVRGALGLAGRTDVLVPGSDSPRFRRNDRQLFAPLCLVLAAGAARARHR